MKSVEIWVDPICPWAWMTSRWLLEVERLGEVKVQFRLMSLEYLNRDRTLTDENGVPKTHDSKPARVLTAARMQFGPDLVRPLYEELGKRIHVARRGTSDIDSIIDESLAALNLPADLATPSADVDEELIRDHNAAMDQVGTDVGTPVISVGGVTFFGPVITPAPKGEAAVRLWNGVLLVASTPGFYEIKRTRDKGPDFS